MDFKAQRGNPDVYNIAEKMGRQVANKRRKE